MYIFSCLLFFFFLISLGLICLPHATPHRCKVDVRLLRARTSFSLCCGFSLRDQPVQLPCPVPAVGGSREPESHTGDVRPSPLQRSGCPRQHRGAEKETASPFLVSLPYSATAPRP